MPLNPAVLGALLVAEVGPTDPLGIAGYMAMGAPIVSWTLSSLVADPTKGTPLIAAGATILGTGGFNAGSTATLKTALAAAVGIKDAVGIAKVGIVVQHYADTLATKGQIVPLSLIGYIGPSPPGPPIGPVTGTGTVVLSDDFKFYEALNVTDAPGIAKWKAFGNALKTHLQTAALVTPAAMLNPAAGGLVTGTGTVS